MRFGFFFMYKETHWPTSWRIFVICHRVMKGPFFPMQIILLSSTRFVLFCPPGYFGSVLWMPSAFRIYLFIFGKLTFANPSILFRLSGARSWGQEPKQRRLDLPLPGYLLQLIWGKTKAFPGQLRDLISPACTGSGHAMNTSPRGGSLSDARNTSTASFQCGGVAALLWAPLGWPNSSHYV